jgi:arginine decarboxylase
MLPTPRRYSLAAASAEGEHELTAFDKALLKAGVGNVNLLRVSSILPPGAIFETRLDIPPGSLVPIAYGTLVCSEKGAHIAAAVAVGIGAGAGDFGVIMEFAGHCGRQDAERRVSEMVTEAFQYRGMELAEIRVVAAEHLVVTCGCVFAAVPLWY